MRTAKEIWTEDNVLWRTTQGGSLEDHIRHSINKAREETIYECAEAAKSEWVRWGEHMGHQVDRQSILKLIETLK